MKKKQYFPELTEWEDSHRLEIRERTLEHGLAFPSNEELIMLILGSGTRKTPVRELARHVLEIVMSSNNENLVENLLKLDGMGKSKALMIAAALELGKRVNKNPEGFLSVPQDIVPYIQNYAMEKQEYFLCVSLNGAMEILSIRVICIGSSNMAVIRPSEVFSEAVKEHASAIVICHNHPSGDPRPSDKDIQTTIRLSQAAELLGIALLDHIIITKSDYFSFMEHNIFMEEKNYFQSKKNSL
ncbi:MAG: DNA repair protein RadC [Treponema sp.]|uniref:JAB domain-containing protein n=1 Tax=Treponema sp. TaxID=166 RepID=UPI001B6AFD63|nr:DNA repair protein RadC [Treponema sp.]MBP3771934.1 DNA repair protein RadC [Treponema sp.]MBQ9283151.1 DNA repair protein RadC [Treponema sp.]